MAVPTGTAQLYYFNHLAESGTPELPTPSQEFSPESVPPKRLNDLCVVCGQRPRVGEGKLSRCIPCIKAEAARARDAREAAETRLAGAKIRKLRPDLKPLQNKRSGL